MKKHFLYCGVIILTCAVSSCVVHERYIVRERPSEVVYVRPAPPSQEHIWISGDWVWSGGGYHWREGRWERRREGVRWYNGYWRNPKGGWKWTTGHWGP